MTWLLSGKKKVGSSTENAVALFLQHFKGLCSSSAQYEAKFVAYTVF
jgi:hypothetical protein